MLNILFNSKKAKRHYFEMMFVAFFYSIISIFIGIWFFPEYGSLVAVFLTLISCLYIFQGVIKREEAKEDFFSKSELMREHFNTLKMFLFVFIGVVLAFSFFTYFLPPEKSVEIFGIQNLVLENMIGDISGKSIAPGEAFEIILINNLKVFFVSLIFSLFYGAGAIFILIWNGSIMGYVIGGILNSKGIIHAPMTFFGYFLHGLPEMFSYLIAVLAGGIIYFAFLKGDYKRRENFKNLTFDVLLLLLIGVLLVVFSAFLEVFVSSSFF